MSEVSYSIEIAGANGLNRSRTLRLKNRSTIMRKNSRKTPAHQLALNFDVPPKRVEKALAPVVSLSERIKAKQLKAKAAIYQRLFESADRLL